MPARLFRSSAFNRAANHWAAYRRAAYHWVAFSEA